MKNSVWAIGSGISIIVILVSLISIFVASYLIPYDEGILIDNILLSDNLSTVHRYVNIDGMTCVVLIAKLEHSKESYTYGISCDWDDFNYGEAPK